LAEALSECPYLETLRLAQNSSTSSSAQGGSKPGAAPAPPPALATIAEAIPSTMKEVDFAESGVDRGTAIVAAVALAGHRRLETLRVAGNPIGEDGVRMLVTGFWLQEELSRMETLDLDGVGLDYEVGHVPMSLVDPSGSLLLDLGSPVGRAQLRHYLRLWATRVPIRPLDKVFLNLCHSGAPITPDVAAKWHHDPLSIPRSGYAEFVFVHSLRVPGETNPLSRNVMRESRTLLQDPAFRRLLKCLIASKTSRGAIVRVVATDSRFSAEQFCDLYDRFGTHFDAGAALRDLLLDVVDDPAGLCCRRWASEGAQQRLRGAIAADSHGELPPTQHSFRAFAMLCGNNPSGRYALDVAIPTERAVANHIVTLAHYFQEQAKAVGLADTSQLGNYCVLRNVSVDHHPVVLQLHRPLMREGILRFDFVMPRLMEAGSKAMPSEIFDTFVETLSKSACPVPHRLHSLRRVSPRLQLSAAQLATLVEVETQEPPRQRVFGDGPQCPTGHLLAPGGVAPCSQCGKPPHPDETTLTCKACRLELCQPCGLAARVEGMVMEIVVVLWARLVDPGEVKRATWFPEEPAQGPGGLRRSDLAGLMDRLGVLNVCHWSGFSDLQFMLDLRNFEGFTMLRLLLALCKDKTELGKATNVRHVPVPDRELARRGRNTLPSLVEDLPDLPRSWIAAPPRSGYIEGVYQPEGQNDRLRRELARLYLATGG